MRYLRDHPDLFWMMGVYTGFVFYTTSPLDDPWVYVASSLQNRSSSGQPQFFFFMMTIFSS